MNIKSLGLAALASVMFAAPGFAHHSFSMFDQNKAVSVTGNVKEFEWINPHTWLHMVALENGKMVTWSFEGGGPGQLSVSGWKPDSVKPGDKITVTFRPLRDGSHGGQLLEVTLPDGRKLCQGAECRAAAGVQGPGRQLAPAE